MVYYLNELSIRYPCTSNEEQAKELMEKFITICRKVIKLGYDSLRYDISLKGVALTTNYYIESWVKDMSVEKEIRDRFRSITINTPFIDLLEEKLALERHLYSYNDKFPIGLGLAVFRETIAISFLTDQEWNVQNISIDYINEEDMVCCIDVFHIADLPHIESFKKIFEFNPKHGKGGKGAQPNQSIMYCRSTDDADILLNTALKHPKKDRWYCNFDTINNRFIVFLPHDEVEGKYHGFHYENTPNADADRDLNNPQNGIPTTMQAKLKQRMKVYIT
jgi:hypothetical protein